MHAIEREGEGKKEDEVTVGRVGVGLCHSICSGSTVHYLEGGSWDKGGEEELNLDVLSCACFLVKIDNPVGFYGKTVVDHRKAGYSEQIRPAKENSSVSAITEGEGGPHACRSTKFKVQDLACTIDNFGC